MTNGILCLGVCLICLWSVDAANAQTTKATEPTNAAEAAKKSQMDAEVEAKYQALIATLKPEEQEWEKALQANLGPFYLPFHKKELIANKNTAWSFVRDIPQLPRVLIIGDSVSRGYTVPVRDALAGKANVHRAPENCGPTANGIKKLDIWLGDGKWDVIHFNFGIHDRQTPLKDYEARLEAIVVRLEKTNAKLIWGTTTPIPDNGTEQTAKSIVDRNEVAAKVMLRHHIAVDDLYGFISPKLATLQNPHDVHFNAKGYEALGAHVAESIEAVLKDASVAPTTRSDDAKH